MDNYLIGSLIAASFLGYSVYKGYFTSGLNWINDKHQKFKFLLSIVNNINGGMTTNNENKNSNISFSVNDTDTSATIIYQRMNQQYIMLVPYNRRYVIDMSQFKVELLRVDNEPVNITQQPGIPYLVSSSSLGGYAIRITNEETGVFKEYLGSAIPLYGDDVMEINQKHDI
jgi:hypothetical protein